MFDLQNACKNTKPDVTILQPQYWGIETGGFWGLASCQPDLTDEFQANESISFKKDRWCSWGWQLRFSPASIDMCTYMYRICAHVNTDASMNTRTQMGKIWTEYQVTQRVKGWNTCINQGRVSPPQRCGYCVGGCPRRRRYGGGASKYSLVENHSCRERAC